MIALVISHAGDIGIGIAVVICSLYLLRQWASGELGEDDGWQDDDRGYDMQEGWK